MAEKEKSLQDLEQEYQSAQTEAGLNEQELSESLEIRGSTRRKVNALLGDETDTKILKFKDARESFDEKLNKEILLTLSGISHGQPRYMAMDSADDFYNELHYYAYQKLNEHFPDSVEAKKKFLEIARKIATQPTESHLATFSIVRRAIEMSKGQMDLLTYLFETINEKGTGFAQYLVELSPVIKNSTDNAKKVSTKMEELLKESGKDACFNITFNRNQQVYDMDSFMRRADYLELTFGRLENNFAYSYFDEMYKKQGREKAMSFIQKVVAKYKPTLKENEVVELAKAA